MSLKNSARAIADAGSGIILATAEIAAPPERVFRALTTPDEIVRWWGSDEVYHTTGWTADLRVGGRWRAEGRGADGQPFAAGGRSFTSVGADVEARLAGGARHHDARLPAGSDPQGHAARCPA